MQLTKQIKNPTDFERNYVITLKVSHHISFLNKTATALFYCVVRYILLDMKMYPMYANAFTFKIKILKTNDKILYILTVFHISSL